MARPRKSSSTTKNDSGATPGYEAELWQMVERLTRRAL